MILLSVKNVGKSFRKYKSEWYRFANWFGLKIKPVDESWVLRNINFYVHSGESIGIIGQNGVGKSTLLKMVTGTLQPSEGQIIGNGRISAILELGMGFNPDFTGRQNVMHTAGLMGFSEEKIHQAMKNIEAFAEIGEYFDQPVRVYSSGMQMRVAFAVATGFRPDLLIVDEALSVGDSYFQLKCMAKIREFQKDGTSLLFVSHDPTSIKALCDRAILLSAGGIVKQGPSSEVVDYYQALMVKKEHDSYAGFGKTDKVNGKKNLSNINDKILILEDALESVKITLLNKDGKEVDNLFTGMPLTVKVDAKFKKKIVDPHIGFGIRNRFGDTIYETNTYCLQHNLGVVLPTETLSASFRFLCDLGYGDYNFVLGITNKGFDTGSFEEVIYYDQNITPLKIIPIKKESWIGYINLKPTVEWSVK